MTKKIYEIRVSENQLLILRDLLEKEVYNGGNIGKIKSCLKMYDEFRRILYEGSD